MHQRGNIMRGTPSKASPHARCVAYNGGGESGYASPGCGPSHASTAALPRRGSRVLPGQGTVPRMPALGPSPAAADHVRSARLGCGPWAACTAAFAPPWIVCSACHGCVARGWIPAKARLWRLAHTSTSANRKTFLHPPSEGQ
jgi:hypothetical protein